MESNFFDFQHKAKHLKSKWKYDKFTLLLFIDFYFYLKVFYFGWINYKWCILWQNLLFVILPKTYLMAGKRGRPSKTGDQPTSGKKKIK